MNQVEGINMPSGLNLRLLILWSFLLVRPFSSSALKYLKYRLNTFKISDTVQQTLNTLNYMGDILIICLWAEIICSLGSSIIFLIQTHVTLQTMYGL
jgi:hypothetical protein